MEMFLIVLFYFPFLLFILPCQQLNKHKNFQQFYKLDDFTLKNTPIDFVSKYTNKALKHDLTVNVFVLKGNDEYKCEHIQTIYCFAIKYESLCYNVYLHHIV